jgi:hypothetical protein
LDAKFRERVAFELGRVFRGAVGEGFRHAFTRLRSRSSSRVSKRREVAEVCAARRVINQFLRPQDVNPKL